SAMRDGMTRIGGGLLASAALAAVVAAQSVSAPDAYYLRGMLRSAYESVKLHTKAITAPTRGRNAYAGTLIVLLDSGSAAAAELFARLVQLEHRGVVIGDRSAGAVMESRFYPFQLGSDSLRFYGFSVTDADLLMKDGRSLEKSGVIPDEPL